MSEVLKIKARKPTGLIPGLTNYEVVEELDPTEGNIFTCKFIFYGDSFEDKVTIFLPSHVCQMSIRAWDPMFTVKYEYAL